MCFKKEGEQMTSQTPQCMTGLRRDMERQSLKKEGIFPAAGSDVAASSQLVRARGCQRLYVGLTGFPISAFSRHCVLGCCLIPVLNWCLVSASGAMEEYLVFLFKTFILPVGALSQSSL